MSKKIQITDHRCSKVLLMREQIKILTVEKDDGDGLITTFSDGTTAGYVAEELLELRPKRELTEVGQEKVAEWQKAKIENIAGENNMGRTIKTRVKAVRLREPRVQYTLTKPRKHF
jgi:hypothetical protein